MKDYERNNRILFVDDEAPVLSSFKSLLHKDGLEIHTLQDSTQVWQLLEETGPFAVVLSDQRMPGLDGIGVLEAVAHKHPTTIRIMVTGYADHHATLRAINTARISSYVPKPWDDNELRELVHDGVERYNLAEEKAQLAHSLASSHESLQTLLERMAQHDEERRNGAAETITALVREKELMLREIHHRVKNNMQLISSLLNHHLTSVNEQNARDIWHKAVARIHSMAMVHQELYESEDFGDVDFLKYLRAQVADLVRRSGKFWVTTSVEGDGTTIGIDRAVPLGMLTHELVANALEHGFRGREIGSLRLQMHLNEAGAIELVVEDDGVGMDEKLVSPGLGLMLVETLAEQLNATVERTRLDGTRYTIHGEEPRRR